MNKFWLLIFLIVGIGYSIPACSQGRTYNWLLGYQSATDINTTSTRARLLFDSLNVTLFPETTKMAFRAAQGNISDENGNLLMASNGCWIANANNDTMLNGNGLNPGSFTTSWCTSIRGIPWSHANIILPYSGNSSKYILFHQTSISASNLMADKIYYTVVDMTLDSGLGGVIQGQKNLVALQDTFSQGMAACKHANGRDWWIVAFKDSSDVIYKMLFTPNGFASIATQSLGVPLHYFGEGQPLFSPNGEKFAYSDFEGPLGSVMHNVRLFDFDRCSGIFSNPHVIDVTDSLAGLGLSFSPNSQLLYATSFNHIFQINIDSLTVDTIAINDGYASPNPPFYTDFWLMYLAANGKIYISTGNGTLDLHYINYPDSVGVSCDVQQHALHLPCYSGRGNVYHPNYYLGCDTTLGCACATGVNEITQHDFKLSISPNPTTGSIKIIYMLPQNKGGMLHIYDINGKAVYSQPLPPWSTLQTFNLSYLTNGVYHCTLTSDGNRASKKLVVIK